MPRVRDYDEIKALNNSMLKHFKRSPMHYMHAWKNPEPHTPALIFGIAAHSWILEPESEFQKDIFVMDEKLRPVPDKDYKTHANRDWKAEIFAQAAKDRKEVITLEQFETIQRMKDALWENELARELMEVPGNKYEQAMEWNWKKTHCKGLTDIQNPYF